MGNNLDEYLGAYIKGAGLGSDPKRFLFCRAKGKADELTERPMSQSDACRMVRRRARDTGILTKIGNHTFRATGITAYLKNGGSLEIA